MYTVHRYNVDIYCFICVYFKFIFKVVAICPHLFPMSFAQCLVAIAADRSQEQDRLGRACLATICELGKYTKAYNERIKIH